MSNPLKAYIKSSSAQAFGSLLGASSSPMSGIKGTIGNVPMVQSNAHALRNFLVPLQINRIKTDLESWRLAIVEAENAYYPHRYRIQQMLIDVVIEGHTQACIKRRKQLALLKQFKIGKEGKEGKWIENVNATKLFKKKKWFKEMLSHILDAQFYGYSLINLGDLVVNGKDYTFVNLTSIKRWNVSPDRRQVVQVPYQIWGIDIDPKAEIRMFESHDKKNATSFFDKDDNGVPFDDWLLYIDTPTDNGSSICGYGLLYPVALYSILLKNNLGHNAKFNEMFVAPYRHIKTDEKYDSEEYNIIKRSAAQMGAYGYLLTGTNDEVEFIQGNNGTGYQSYRDLEKSLQSSISKLIGGHENFMSSQATALGGGSGGKKNSDEDSTPEAQAIAAMEKEQDEFLLSALNDTVYDKLRNCGMPLLDDECFYLPNDKEDFSMRIKNDEANLATAQVWKMGKDAGLKLDAKTFETITGIPTEDAPEPEPAVPSAFGAKPMKMAAKLNKMYSQRH